MKPEVALINEVVLPGQILKEINTASNKKITLGPGLKRVANNIIICKCGILRRKGSNFFWVDSLQKRYVPAKDETVVGTVVKKAGDYYRVDIGASDHALLHYLSFEGATKKYKPDIQVGDVIFGRLVVSCSDMEPELFCTDITTGKKDRYGKLSNEGFLFSCSLHLIRKILNPKCPFLSSLGKAFTFESAIGMNGKVWVKGDDVTTTIAVANAILTAEVMNQDELKEFYSKFGQK